MKVIKVIGIGVFGVFGIITIMGLTSYATLKLKSTFDDTIERRIYGEVLSTRRPDYRSYAVAALSKYIEKAVFGNENPIRRPSQSYSSYNQKYNNQHEVVQDSKENK